MRILMLIIFLIDPTDKWAKVFLVSLYVVVILFATQLHDVKKRVAEPKLFIFSSGYTFSPYFSSGSSSSSCPKWPLKLYYSTV